MWNLLTVLLMTRLFSAARSMVAFWLPQESSMQPGKQALTSVEQAGCRMAAFATPSTSPELDVVGGNMEFTLFTLTRTRQVFLRVRTDMMHTAYEVSFWSKKNTLYEQYQHHLINNNCCTSTVNILLTANETGPNATDNHNKQLNHTSVADSFRLCKVFLPNVQRKESFLLQNSHCLFYMSPQLSPPLFPLSMWRCLALVQAQKTLAQSLQEDAFL